MNIDIRDDLLIRLQKYAQSQNRSIDEVLEQLIPPVEEAPPIEESPDIPPRGTFARMAYDSQQLKFRSEETDAEASDIPPRGTFARMAYYAEKADFHSEETNISGQME